MEDVARRLGGDEENIFTRFPDGYYLGQAPGRKPGETMLAQVMLVRMAGNPNEFKDVLRTNELVRGAVAKLESQALRPEPPRRLRWIRREQHSRARCAF